MDLVLDRMPAPGGAAFKALGSLRRRPGADVVVPPLSVSLATTRFDPERLQAYREICGFAEAGGVPIPYPQVHAVHLQMHLMTQPQFPLPLVGLVHLRNRIEQERELAADESLAIQVAVAGSQRTERGLEFDLQTTCTDADGKAVWTGVATILHRIGKPSRKKGPPPPADNRLSEYKAIEAPEDIGRRYGRIAGDVNPIHLHPLSARLLGFPRHIAHGMWTLARCTALLQGGLGRPPRTLEVQFKQPLFLPGRAALRFGRTAEGYAFSLIGADGGKLHLTGNLH